MGDILVLCGRCWQSVILILIYAFAISMLLFPRRTIEWLFQAEKKIAKWLKIPIEQTDMEKIQKWPPTTFRRLRWFGFVLLISTTLSVLIAVRRGAIIP